MAKSEKLSEMPARNSKKDAPGPETKMIHKLYKNRVSLSDEQKNQLIEMLNVRLAASTASAGVSVTARSPRSGFPPAADA